MAESKRMDCGCVTNGGTLIQVCELHRDRKGRRLLERQRETIKGLEWDLREDRKLIDQQRARLRYYALAICVQGKDFALRDGLTTDAIDHEKVIEVLEERDANRDRIAEEERHISDLEADKRELLAVLVRALYLSQGGEVLVGLRGDSPIEVPDALRAALTENEEDALGERGPKR